MKKGLPILITGATDGIGLALANLLSVDNEIIVVGRSQQKLIEHFEKNANVHTYQTDLSITREIEALCADLNQNHEKLGQIIHNASYISSTRAVSNEGVELQLMVNYLAPVILTNSMMPKLRQSNGSVLFVNSRAHNRASVKLDDINLLDGYSLSKAYNRSKLYLMMYANHMHTTMRGEVRFNSWHPGLVNTAIGSKHTNSTDRFIWSILRRLGKSPEVAAGNLYRLIVSDQLDLYSGRFYDSTGQASISALAQDTSNIKKLMNWTEELLDNSL